MKLLVSVSELENGKSRQLFPLQCEHCGSTFHRHKNQIQSVLAGSSDRNFKYCSYRCRHLHKGQLVECQCRQCGSHFDKRLAEIKKHPNHFCTSSCAGKYNAANKTTGNRRSKLEIWLEEQLGLQYSTLPIDYNKTSAIGAELDIYIPSLKLAFELNGIFHYEPIFGEQKLGQIQQRDKNKFAACQDQNISLCIIDVSRIKYHKPKTAQPILDIITKIINEKLVGAERFQLSCP